MKYNLVGIDGNAYCIMGYVVNCMKYEKFTQAEIDEYLKDAKSSDYDHLCYVSFLMVDKCNELYEKRNKLNN